MSMQYQPPSLIGASSTNVTANAFLNRFEAARAAGSIIQYEYKSTKETTERNHKGITA